VGDKQRERWDATRFRYRHCHSQGEMFAPTTAVHNANNELFCITPSLHFHALTQLLFPHMKTELLSSNSLTLLQQLKHVINRKVKAKR
jgi:hypothetical protein